MPDVVTFGNVEAQAATYLTPLVGVPVVRVVPATRPAKFVRVLLTGTTRRSLTLADAHLTVECWASGANGDADAEALARLTYGALCAMDLPDGTHVPDGPDGWLGGPYASADPVSGTPRYVMTAIVRQSA